MIHNFVIIGLIIIIDLSARYFFEPIAVETLGVFNASARIDDLILIDLLDDLGQRITSSSGEARETSFLYQRVSVLIQLYNAVLLHDSLPSTDRTDWWSYPNLYISFLNFSSPSGSYVPRVKNNNNCYWTELKWFGKLYGCIRLVLHRLLVLPHQVIKQVNFKDYYQYSSTDAFTDSRRSFEHWTLASTADRVYTDSWTWHSKAA